MMFYNHDFHVNVFINDVSTVVKTHNRKNDVCIFQFVGKFQAPTAFIKESIVIVNAFSFCAIQYFLYLCKTRKAA